MKIKILFLICLLFTGCYNYSELSDFAIITGAGIDYKDKMYELSLMVANTKNSSSSEKEGNSKTSIISGKGKTITEALLDIESKSSKEIYLGHIGVLIINENVPIYNVIDTFFRNPESLKKYYIILSKDATSKDVLKTLSPLDNFPSQNIITNIKNSNKTIGYVPEVIASDFLYNVINNDVDAILPSITIEGKVSNSDNIKDLDKSSSDTYLKLSNIAIFKNYKLVGYATKSESKGINILNNNINNLVIKIKYKDCYVVTKLDNIKTKVTNKVKISSIGSINETNCKIDLTDDKVIKNINKKANKEVHKLVNKAIKKSNETNSKFIKIKNINDYKIYVDININTKGSLQNTIKEIINEKN